MTTASSKQRSCRSALLLILMKGNVSLVTQLSKTSACFMVSAFKKPRDQEIPKMQGQFNEKLARMRMVSEHCIGTPREPLHWSSPMQVMAVWRLLFDSESCGCTFDPNGTLQSNVPTTSSDKIAQCVGSLIGLELPTTAETR